VLGILTQFLQNQLHYSLYQHGFTIYSKTGVEVVYLYFQIPLMILVIAPAIDGLRREWRERPRTSVPARSSIGATSGCRCCGVDHQHADPALRQLLRRIRDGLWLTTGQSVHLVPIQIGFDISGNVVSNPHEAQALAFACSSCSA